LIRSQFAERRADQRCAPFSAAFDDGYAWNSSDLKMVSSPILTPRWSTLPPSIHGALDAWRQSTRTNPVTPGLWQEHYQVMMSGITNTRGMDWQFHNG
jgi:hypothetical protein